MKRFISKTALYVILGLLPNILMGVIRIYLGDKNMPFQINKEGRSHQEAILNPYATFYKDRKTDLSHDTFKHVKNNRDANGLSNVQPNKQPDVVFIGDSFFADLLCSSDSGIQARCNRMLGYNAAYNLGYVSSANFKLYNEYIKKGIIAEPKIIICEISEAYTSRWLSLKAELLSGKQRTKITNYYGLDFLLGNNFSGINYAKLLHRNNYLVYKKMIDSVPVYFAYNRTTHIPTNQVGAIATDLLFIQDYFLRKNIQIYFLIAPDKESLYPSLFGPSGLGRINETFTKCGVHIIDIYTDLLHDPRKYYYDGDLHWNDQALKKLLEVMDQEGIFNSLKKQQIKTP